MNPRGHRAGGSFEDLGDLGIGPIFDHVEHERGSLLLRQAIEQGSGSLELVVILDRSLAMRIRHVLLAQRADSLAPTTEAKSRSARLANGDAVQPRTQTSLSAKVWQGAVRIEEDLLENVLHNFLVRDETPHQVSKSALVSSDDLTIGVRIPIENALHGVRVGIG